MSAKSIVLNFKDFDVANMATPANLKELAVAAKVPANIPPAEQIPLRYNYKIVTDGKVVNNEGTLLVQGPEMFTPSGVTYKSYEKSEKEKKPATPSIFVTFDMTNPDYQQYVGTFTNKYLPRNEDEKEEETKSSGFLGSLYEYCCEQLYNYYKYQQRQPKSREVIGEMFPEKLVIMRKRYTKDDKVDDSLIGTLVPDVNPIKFLKIRSFGIPGTPGYNEASFLSPSGKLVPLAELANMKCRFIPHILWRQIWIGQQKGLTHEVTGAIITEIIQSTGISLRLEEARQELLSRNPDIAAKVDEMLNSTSVKKTDENTSATTLQKEESASEPPGKMKLKLSSLQGLGN